MILITKFSIRVSLRNSFKELQAGFLKISQTSSQKKENEHFTPALQLSHSEYILCLSQALICIWEASAIIPTDKMVCRLLPHQNLFYCLLLFAQLFCNMFSSMCLIPFVLLSGLFILVCFHFSQQGNFFYCQPYFILDLILVMEFWGLYSFH